MSSTSIRARTTVGYVLTFGFVLLVAVALFVDLLVVERGVGRHAAITQFLDAALEMRRYEKNYFLYGYREDLEQALRYAEAAGALAAEDGGAGVPDAVEASRLLAEYRARLRELGQRPTGGDAAAIRDRGRAITEIAERLYAEQGRRIRALVRRARLAVVALVGVLAVGAALVARHVLTTALRPLEELEAGMRRIASGDFSLLPEDSGSAEMRSMNGAFNRMIREVFEHRREALRSERLASLGTMLAGIAHELNNPLSNVSTSAELLREADGKAGPAERRELLDQIQSETERATHVIRTVLDFSRDAPFEQRPTNLSQALLGSLVLVRGELPAHVAVELDVPDDLELLADKAKLQQVFVNLLSNAADAVRDTGRDGRIAITARPTGVGEVEVAFRDTGTGIAREHLDRVFDPFFSTKDVGRGTGLGLWLTHRIVSQHGGTIAVESAVGEGTTVTLRLPRAERAPAAAPPAPAARAQAGVLEGA